jgi:hypothetical protein
LYVCVCFVSLFALPRFIIAFGLLSKNKELNSRNRIIIIIIVIIILIIIVFLYGPVSSVSTVTSCRWLLLLVLKERATSEHIAHSGDLKNAHKILARKLEGKGYLGT